MDVVRFLIIFHLFNYEVISMYVHTLSFIMYMLDDVTSYYIF